MIDGKAPDPLENAVVSPRPASAEREFLFAAGCCLGVVQSLWRVDDSKFPQKYIQGWISVAESGKFNPITIDVPHDGGFQTDLQLPKVSQLRGFHPEELNQFVGVFHGSCVDAH